MGAPRGQLPSRRAPSCAAPRQIVGAPRAPDAPEGNWRTPGRGRSTRGRPPVDRDARLLADVRTFGSAADQRRARPGPRATLREQGIEARVHYPTTLAACPPFAAYAGRESFAESERATRELLSVPCHAEMTDAEIAYVEHALTRLC